MQKQELSMGDKCILVRNQNEIKEIMDARKRYINDTDKAIKALRNQSREIMGRINSNED